MMDLYYVREYSTEFLNRMFLLKKPFVIFFIKNKKEIEKINKNKDIIEKFNNIQHKYYVLNNKNNIIKYFNKDELKEEIILN